MTKFLPPRFRNRSAFSLIELVAVVTILLVLALLGTSVMAGLRNKSLNTRCMHNLKQVGVALFAFAADHQQMIPPRRMGLYRDPVLSGRLEWVNRLIDAGYVANPDILYCPSFTPFSNQRSSVMLPADKGPFRTYGIRSWTPPGYIGFGKGHPVQEEDKRLSLITEPADFFLVADTVWIHPTYQSQGYGINPGMGAEQLIHTRHSKMANALFADGHVAPKPASYFLELNKANRQRAYSGGKDLPFGVTEEVDFQ